MSCPRCAGRDVGRIGPEHYYCWDCCCEFAWAGGQWQVFDVDAEGTLLPVDVVPAPGGDVARSKANRKWKRASGASPALQGGTA